MKTEEEKRIARDKQREYRSRPEVKIKAREWARRAAAKYPERAQARVAVNQAVKDWDLLRPDHCQNCGDQTKLQAHHHKGYGREQWLDVVWLCDPCHVLRHLKGSPIKAFEEMVAEHIAAGSVGSLRDKWDKVVENMDKGELKA